MKAFDESKFWNRAASSKLKSDAQLAKWVNQFSLWIFFLSESELLKMVREVSEDRIYDTIEFNEFLQMMSKQQRNYTQDSLRDAFR